MLRELIGFTKEVFALRGAETVQGPRGEKREFNWLTAVCLICRLLRVGETLQGTLTQSATNSMVKVHSSEGHQAKPRNIGITALCFGLAFRSTSSQHILGTSTSPISSTGLIPGAPNHMETAYDCAKKNKPSSVPCATRNMSVSWVQRFFLLGPCLALQRSHTMSLTWFLRTERSAAHLKAQMRDPIRLATGSQKEVTTPLGL